jgi:hypothetical protein
VAIFRYDFFDVVLESMPLPFCIVPISPCLLIHAKTLQRKEQIQTRIIKLKDAPNLTMNRDSYIKLPLNIFLIISIQFPVYGS